MTSVHITTVLAIITALTAPAHAQTARLDRLKREAAEDVQARAKLTQELVDQIFSFSELGFQEYETARFLTGLLRDNGFTVQDGIAGMPTAWVATWGSGKPVISLGADIDDVPQASQYPGVACHRPMVPGAPGHGEGHNAGQAVAVTAALAVKQLMERDRLPGTIQLWPGVAEELVGAKSYFIRDGLFRNADVVLFSHVGDGFGVAWGDTPGSGLVSVLFSFEGRSAHSAGQPWRGRSALDAVSLMEVGWQFRREHLRLPHRSHSVIVDGGDQPNVVPPTASIWFYFRENDYPHITELWAIGDSIARGAAMMTGTRLASQRVLGSAWPAHFSKPVAEATFENIRLVGLPAWDEADHTLARGLQKELGVNEQGLVTSIPDRLPDPPRESERRGGGSNDLGDITWNVPTVTLNFPGNMPGLPGHNWANGISMATPIAHKGATAGAKVLAMTALDVLLRPDLVQAAWDYFRNVQTKTIKYEPFIRPEDRPAIDLNRDIMTRYKPELEKFYYDRSRHRTYLEQLGVAYPTLRSADGRCGPTAIP
ncbi:MAG: peptidase dimerization domain-containing protein [Gemmatimonadetes bacterium]|nr:peptidase dimerization domain-containing protein [Gemmatimonadota bacterium]